MAAEKYDVIVVGVGAHGSAALWHLAARGQRVLGLEQFERGHRLGSSHGGTRVFRFAYNEGAFYVPMMQRAAELWRELDKTSSERLMHVTGTLEMGPVGSGRVENSLAASLTHNLPHELLGAADITARFPAFNLPAGYTGIWQPDGGFLMCDLALAHMQRQATAAGAELHEREAVLDWQPTADGSVTVTTSRATYTAGQLVLTTGAWMADHAAALRPLVHTVRQVFAWFEPRDAEVLRQGTFPVFMVSSDVGDFYGFPLDGEGRFKIGGPHFAREPHDVHSPDRTPSPRQREAIQAFLPRFIPAGAGPVIDVRGCMFAVTPDEHFIIDRLPGHPQVLAISACSGHGFKFASVIGEIAADLTTTGTSRFDLTPFRIDRFPCS